MTDSPSIKLGIEIIRGIKGCLLINDNYHMDLRAIELALNLLSKHNFLGDDSSCYKGLVKKTLIVSDIRSYSLPVNVKYRKLSEWSVDAGVRRIIAIGEEICRAKDFFTMDFFCFQTTEDFLKHWYEFDFRNEVILIKGARSFTFELIVYRLKKTFHDTVYEINLSSIEHNINYYRSILNPGTKIMAMVKAFSYGNGSYEVANALEQSKIDILGVAYVDEGIKLRQEGISLPIMVMNPNINSISAIIKYRLEPGIYNFNILNNFIYELKKQIVNIPYPIHVKIDTGMHRLGFSITEISKLTNLIKYENSLRVKSIFSHMAASENPTQRTFSLEQIKTFRDTSEQFALGLGYQPLKHILNSSGILYFPEYTFDMVRLGLGLYGISPDDRVEKKLKIVGVLKTTISQIKTLFPGDSVSYGRKFYVKKFNTRIATLPVGYADGIDKRLGEGKAYVKINDSYATIIGEICMDMLMVDVTNIKAEEGDEAILFGKDPSLYKLANICNTIPYELLTRISPRVCRIYIKDL